MLTGAALAATACTTTAQNDAEMTAPPPVQAFARTLPSPPSVPATTAYAPVEGDATHMYREIFDGAFRIASVDTAAMNPAHVRQEVDYATTEVPGTIVVDQEARFLYFIMPDGRAMRYAVGVGPAARAFQDGDAIIDRKAEWPRWIPTDSMIERSPEQYERYREGIDGGPGNPMGARALYMQRDGQDTYYRVHGTNDPTSIGRSVSAGCIRLLNQDIIDLHARVSIGSRIVVL